MNAWFTVAVLRMLAIGALGAGISAATTAGVSSFGTRLAAIVLGAAVMLSMGLMLLPSRIRRQRHRGHLDRAAGELALLTRLAPTTAMRLRARIELASALLAQGQVETGAALLQTVPRGTLSDPLKATWDANYAYYLLAAHKDPSQAFALADQLPSQPDPRSPPAFRPVRGLALLALGHTKEAVTELTGALLSNDLGPWEKAEANYHLAQAWKALGHPAYAADHLLRTCNSCASSPYAEQASKEIASDTGSSSA